MAYHHFASVNDVTRELVACLKPSGTLGVGDILRVEAAEGELPIMAKTSPWSHTRVDFPKMKSAGCWRAQGSRRSLSSASRPARRKDAMSSFSLPRAPSPLPNCEKSV